LVTCNVGAIASTTDEKYRLEQAISYTILEIFTNLFILLLQC
jgi:hypothetical protein